MNSSSQIYFNLLTDPFILSCNDDPKGKKTKDTYKEIKKIWRERGLRSKHIRFFPAKNSIIMQLTPSQLKNLARYHAVFEKFIGGELGKTIFDGFDSLAYSSEHSKLDLDRFKKDAELNLKFSHLIDVTPVTPQTPEESTPVATLIRWLSKDNFQGVIIGEGHRDVAAKQLLIQNMETLKNLGVTAIFLEFLGIEDQDAVNRYLRKKDNPIPLPPELEAIIRTNDESLRLPIGGRLIDVIDEAKRHEIRIIGIESEASKALGYNTYDGHNGSDNLRNLGLNYMANIIIHQQMGNEKYVALVGNAHVSNYKAVPGLSQLLGAPGLLIFDRNNDLEKPIQIGFNVTRPIIGLDDTYHAVFEIGREIEMAPAALEIDPTTIFENMSRQETIRTLSKTGNNSWLVRTSESAPGEYVLAVKSSKDKTTQYKEKNLDDLLRRVIKLNLKSTDQIK